MTGQPAGAVYTRSSPQLPPVCAGSPLADSLTATWRPLLDLTGSERAPVRLRLAPHVGAWLVGDAPRWSWCSRVSVPGLRQQVVAHGGLVPYVAASPDQLPAASWTPAWAGLIDAMTHFAKIDWRRRTLTIFQLTQLSYHRAALALADTVAPDGNVEADRFRLDAARVAASTPGRTDAALRVFAELSSSADRLVRLSAAFQGIGHSLRTAHELADAHEFATRGAADLDLADERWQAALVASRYFRAVALLHLTAGEPRRAAAAAEDAGAWHARVAAGARDEADRLVALENERYLLELAARLRPERAVELSEQVVALDPHCVQALVAAADAHARVGDLDSAVGRYESAGALGTAVGAIAWWRAALCHDARGVRVERERALRSCLALDPYAIEPRAALNSLGLDDNVDQMRLADNNA